MKKSFDNKKYIKLQSDRILERVNQFSGKLYMEIGGKIFDDYHAARVFKGFEKDSKVKVLLSLKKKVEMVLIINANDIQGSKVRGDLGITYEDDVLRLVDNFERIDLPINSVVITHYENQPSVDVYMTKLNNLGIKTYKHYPIQGYPHNIEKIISEEGFGKNDYIETNKPIVVVTAPGPGSGKMATCLSQLYHDNLRGIKSGYAKFETFPVWNLPLKHPVNLAYEAATADLNDVNMIDYYHLEKYNIQATTYNRDIEVFPVLSKIFEKIYGVCPYASPTDMGVNMVGYAIIDDVVACESSKQEIIRRYLDAICSYKLGKVTVECLDKIAVIMKSLNVSVNDRKCVGAALKKSKELNKEVVAIELNNGKILLGKTSNLLSASAAAVINVLKYYAKLPNELDLISQTLINPILKLKKDKLHYSIIRLDLSDILVALAITATTNPAAELALNQLEKLNGAELHSSVMLSGEELKTIKTLNINATMEPIQYTKLI